MNWLSLITTLPTENATARMRAWRTLKASGAAVLRDGVYLMPERDACRVTLEAVAADVHSGGGTAYVLRMEAPESTNFSALFNRNGDYAALLADLAKLRDGLNAATAPEPDTLKQARKLRKTFLGIADIDFFPGAAREQANLALQDLEAAVARTLAPNEPHAVAGSISRLSIADYQNRLWATRRRPWVDRLASAWLIRRFIDPQARFLWLDSPADCPADALGFDFDGASFSHVGARVTFEVLLASFGLERSGLKRLGALVHFLDAGGIQAPEAAGIENVLLGLRETLSDDDQLLSTASSLFDGLLVTFDKGTASP